MKRNVLGDFYYCLGLEECGQLILKYYRHSKENVSELTQSQIIECNDHMILKKCNIKMREAEVEMEGNVNRAHIASTPEDGMESIFLCVSGVKLGKYQN